MGIANAQRALQYIRVITEFISQPEYKNLVAMFCIMNEPLQSTIGKDALISLCVDLACFNHATKNPFLIIIFFPSSYIEAHNMIRSITGVGEGNGPFIAIGDGFAGVSSWADFLPGSDRIALDTHPYFAFSKDPATDPIDTGTGVNAGGKWPAAACTRWATNMNNRYVQ
jgi:glucan 1,3-beta-glucosidase